MCKTTLILTLAFFSFQATCLLTAQDADRKQILARYTTAAQKGGNAVTGKLVFESEKSNCRKCHSIGKKEIKAGPDLMVIGDKLDREQMIQSVLEPSALIHPDHASHAITTVDGKIITGVLQSQSKESIELINGKGELVKIDVKDIDEQHSAQQQGALLDSTHLVQVGGGSAALSSLLRSLKGADEAINFEHRILICDTVYTEGSLF